MLKNIFFFLLVMSFCSNVFAKTKYFIWSEFLTPKQVWSYIPELKKEGVGLMYGFRKEDMSSPYWKKIFLAAKDGEVDIRPWPILSEEDGYWTNKWNLDLYEKHLTEIFRNFDQVGYSPKWLVMDMEPPLYLLKELERLVKKLRVVKALKMLKREAKKVSLFAARKQIRNIIQGLHDKGVKVHGVFNPLILHDTPRRLGPVQNVLGTPLNGIKWDRVSFMVYRPFFEMFTGGLSSAIVSHYTKRGRMSVPLDTMAVDLGPVGPAGIIPSKRHYKTFKELRPDLQAVAAKKIKFINLYSLDGMHQMKTPLSEWVNNKVRGRSKKMGVKEWALIKAMNVAKRLLPDPR